MALPTPTPTPSVRTGGTGAKVHTVVSGDTIISIAATYGKDWRQLLTLNGLDEDSILQIGQKVQIE
jgi:LysM repeat protein